MDIKYIHKLRENIETYFASKVQGSIANEKTVELKQSQASYQTFTEKLTLLRYLKDIDQETLYSQFYDIIS